MEMNTRLQVEHPVTEALIGEDLVAWQFKVAAGEYLPLDQNTIAQRFAKCGWALEARIYAENPLQDFVPDSGKIRYLKTPKISEHIRIDAGFIQGDTISSCYDGMISKLIVSGPSRKSAIQRLHIALQQYEVSGLSTNIEFLKRICRNYAFLDGKVETGFIQKYQTDLFTPDVKTHEIFAQAALGLYANNSSSSMKKKSGPHGMNIGFGNSPQREFIFDSIPDLGKDPVRVIVTTTNFSCYTVKVNINNAFKIFEDVACEYHAPKIISFFPHGRICSTVLWNDNIVTVFQQGCKTELRIAPPNWNRLILDTGDQTSCILAPMHCKILRIDVKEGDMVEKDDPLIVYVS